MKNKIPNKLKDPERFTISVSIRSREVGSTLCDLGARNNMMHASFFRTLGSGEPRPTTVTLQLADRFLAYPDEIIEDVLIKVGPFILPVDFIILDYEADASILLILGRGFLYTTDAVIQVKSGKMPITADGQKAVFDVFREARLPHHYEDFTVRPMVVPGGCKQEVEQYVFHGNTTGDQDANHLTLVKK